MNHKNIREFLEWSIKYDNIQEILDNYDNLSMRGFIYERLWDIIFKFNYCDLFNSPDYEHKINNMNKAKTKKLVNLNTYLTASLIKKRHKKHQYFKYKNFFMKNIFI